VPNCEAQGGEGPWSCWERWLKELGCDDALNYKDAAFATQFKEKTKDLIDVFFDNVGGDILEVS